MSATTKVDTLASHEIVIEMKEETVDLLDQIEINEGKIAGLEDENIELTRRMCKIEGRCPYCKNWHFPHCRGYKRTL